MSITWQSLTKKNRVKHRTPNMVYLILEDIFGKRVIKITKKDIDKLNAMAAASNDNIYAELAQATRENGTIIIKKTLSTE